MRPHHSLLHLATATLLFTLLPTPLAQSTQDRKAEAIHLNNKGAQLQRRGQYQAALEKYQQALSYRFEK